MKKNQVWMGLIGYLLGVYVGATTWGRVVSDPTFYFGMTLVVIGVGLVYSGILASIEERP